MFRIAMSLGGRPIEDFTFQQEKVIIGRHEGCDIVVDNAGTSRRHACVERTGVGHVLSDLNSFNGTYVKGQKVSQHVLHDQEEFHIGKFCFTIEVMEPVEAMVAESQPTTGLPQPDAAGGYLPEMTYQLDLDQIRKIKNKSVQGKKFELVQIYPMDADQAVTLDQPYFVLGKGSSAAIQVAGLWAPSKVAVLVRVDHGYRVVGLHKKLRINGKPVDDQPLRDNDVLSVGRLQFRYSAP
jgi:hypothetical protein